MPIDINELIDTMNKRAAGEDTSSGATFTPTVHVPERRDVGELSAEMLRRAGPEYAAKVAQNTEVLYNNYNTNVKAVQSKYGASDYAYTYTTDYKEVNAEYVSNLKNLSSQIDEQRSTLKNAIDSGVYGSNASDAQKELDRLNEMYDNTEGLISYIEGDTKSREKYFIDKYEEIDSASSEIKAQYGTGGWDRMTEEQRANAIAYAYRGDTILGNASDYYKNKLSTLAYSADINPVDIAEYNSFVGDLIQFIGEGGAIDRYRSVATGIADGSTEFDYAEFLDLQAYADSALHRLDQYKDMFEWDVYVDMKGTISRISERLPQLLEVALYYDSQAELSAFESMTSEEIGYEIVRLEALRENSNNDTVNGYLEGLITEAKLQMVGKTDQDRAKVYAEMAYESKTIEGRLSTLKDEIAELNDHKNSLQEMYDYYIRVCAQNNQDPLSSPYRDHIIKYRAVCTQLDDVIEVYNAAQASYDKIQSDKEFYHVLEDLRTEFMEKSASTSERVLWTVGNVADSFLDGLVSTSTELIDMIAASSPLAYRGKDLVYTDSDGKIKVSDKHGREDALVEFDKYLAEGGIRNSAAVKWMLEEDEYAKDPLKTYDPSYKNDFTQVINDVSSGLGAYAPVLLITKFTGLPGNVASGAVFGLSTYHSSYNEARENGASMDEARANAFLKATVAAESNIIIGAPMEKAGGLVGKLSKNISAKIANPAVRTLLRWLISSSGEGVEESVESIVGTGIDRITYNPDTTIEWRQVVYEGIIGFGVGGILSGASIPSNYKANKADVDHINELISQAESISSPAEAQALIYELTSYSQLMESYIMDGGNEYGDNIKFLRYHYDAIAQTLSEKMPELIAQNGDVSAMADNIASIVAEGESDNAHLASVLAETNIQLYEAMLEKSNLDPEVRAELESQYETLKQIRDRYGLIDYSQKTDEQLTKYKGVNSIEHNLDTSTPEGRSNVKTGGIETHTLDLLGSKTKYDEVTAHEVLHQGVKSDEKLLPQIKNIMKSQGIDIEAEAEKYKQVYIEQFKRDWYKITPESEQVMMGEVNARDQAYLYAERKYEAEAEEEVAARYFGTVAAELGLGNIVGDNTINRIAAKVGIDGKSRNLSRRILSAVAKYNRVQNAKIKKSQTDTKKKNASGKLFYKLKEYTQKQRDNWKDSKRIVIYESEAQFREFIEESVENKQYDKKMYFGAVSPELASLIKEKTGVEVEGYNCSLSSYEIRKILKDHGNEETERPRGQRAITPDDFLNMPEVIQSPDNISLSPTKYEGKDAVMFEGQFDTGKMTVVAVVSDKHLDLFIQTAYVGVKKGNLATPIDEQASINTPEASRGTVSDNTISQPESKVKSKTSNSQTSEKKSDIKTPKKSKGKTADDVYEKGRKLKVGDKVGEVKLVADESGKPITPVLRASFDRTDVPSYILATVEATGDTALISALEEETALMMMGDLTGERAQLILHDAVEALSEHVRDGNITPEQAAYILSEEYAHPTGADIDTLIDRENMSAVKYSIGEFSDQVDKVLNNTFDKNNHVYMGRTPYRLSEILGIKKLPMLITNNHVYTMTVSEAQAKSEIRFNKKAHYHDLGADIVKKLPEALNNPVMIIKSNTDSTNVDFVVLTDLYDKNGDMVIVAVKPSGKGFYYGIELETNIVKSGYGKENILNYIFRAKEQNRILYAYKKYNQQKQNTPGVQFPDSILSADYNNSLAQYKTIVNNYYMQNSKKDASTDDDSISNYHYSIALPDTDTAAAIDREARVKNIVALANSLQDGVQNDAEYAALERVKSNAENIVQKYNELSKLKAELKDVSFSEGPRDTARITELRNEIDSVNRSLNSLERGLSNARTAAPFKDMMQRKVQGSTAKVRHDYYERQKARAESRKNTETKNKTLREVQKLRRRLANPTKSRNVVNGMQDLASSALTLANAVFSGATNESIAELNIESLSDVEEKALAQYRALVAKRAELQARYGEARASGEDTSAIEAELETVQGQITEHNTGDLKDMFDRERRGIYKKTSGKLFTELKDAYKALENSGDPNVKATYDQQVYEHLDTLSRQAGDVLVRDMHGSQLEALYRAYKMINHVIAEANQLYVNGRKVEANTLADKIVAEVRARGTSDTKVAIFDDLKRFAVDELKPVYLFRYMGSDTLMELYQNMRRGEETWARDVEEAKQHVADLRSKYGSERWDMKKQHMVRLSGGTMDLTLEQIMTIYAYSNRPQAREHMRVGGFVFLTDEKVKIKREGEGKNRLTQKLKESFVTYYRTEENPHILKDADIDLICREYLDDNQRGYVDEMQRFLSVNMAAKGNEISRTLYGIDLFGEKNYFPIQSARDYIQQSMTPVEASSLKNSGMTKQTVPDANNPIVLRNFHDVWAGHVNKMANYHSFVLGIETMNRILGYNIIDGQKNYSMESELISAYGNGVNEYIHQLITDVNGGVQSGSGVSGRIMKLFSLYKKSAVAASVSVVVQQPTAIIRAMAYISPKYFNGITKLDYNNRWEELKQWAPVAIIKDAGGFDTSNSGRTAESYIMAREYGTEGSLLDKAKDKAKGFLSDADYRDESFMWAAGKADQIGWLAIWEAAKAETAEKTDLEGDELLEAAARRFTEVVELTQVYDSVFSRSGYMRDKGDIAKMMTAFMGEPTTSVNMLFDAAMNWKADKKQVAKLGAAVLASIVAANLLKSLWIAGRDDDEDESYVEKFLTQFARNMSSDLFLPNMLPFVRDIMSEIEGGDVPRSDMALISNAVDAVKGLFNDSRSGYRKVEDAAGALGAFFGLPVENVMRDMRTIANNFKSMFVMPTGDRVTDAIGEGLTDNLLFDFIEKISDAMKPTYSTDRIDDALESLEAAAEANGSKISNIHPDRDPPSSFSIKNEKYELSGKEQDEWYTVRAENTARLYGELLDSVLYDTLSDDDKYKALQSIFSYANYLAKVNYCEKNDIEYSDSEYERYTAKMDAGYSIAQLMWEKYTFDEPKMKQADKMQAIAYSGMSITDQLEHVYQLVTYDNDDGELVTTKYDNIKAAMDAGAPLSLVASMMTYYDAVEPVKNKKGETVAYLGTDGNKEKTKTKLMEEWLDSVGHEYSGGAMVAITDKMRHYMYAILYPNSKNPFKAK